jgi:hypothetical protein
MKHDDKKKPQGKDGDTTPVEMAGITDPRGNPPPPPPPPPPPEPEPKG